MNTRAMIAVASFVLCVVCMAAIPFTAPVFAAAFGVGGALIAATVLGVCALVMAYQAVVFTVQG